MKIIKVVNGQVIRFMYIEPSDGQTLYGINLVRAFEHRYGFFSSPKTIEEFNLDTGVTFRHGIYDKTVIGQVKIYNNGILAEGEASTEKFSQFISDIVEWAHKEAGITITQDTQTSNLYNSTLHVELNIDLSKYLLHIQYLLIYRYQNKRPDGTPIPAFQPAGIMLQSSIQGRAPTPFRFERLAGVPYESNVYFSTSALTTADHLDVLGAIETAFKA